MSFQIFFLSGHLGIASETINHLSLCEACCSSLGVLLRGAALNCKKLAALLDLGFTLTLLFVFSVRSVLKSMVCPHHPKPSVLVRLCIPDDACLFLAWTSDLPKHLSRAPRGLTIKTEGSWCAQIFRGWWTDSVTHTRRDSRLGNLICPSLRNLL